MTGAVRIWNRLRKLTKGTDIGGEESIQPTEKEFSYLITCATKVGDIRVMDRVLGELAEDVFVPSVNTCEAIISWFQSERSITMPNQITNTSSALDEIDLQESDIPYMGPVHFICKPDDESAVWDVNRGCKVNSMTGMLSINDMIPSVQLLPLHLSDTAWNEMIIMNESLVLKGEVDGDFTKFAGVSEWKKFPTIFEYPF